MRCTCSTQRLTSEPSSLSTIKSATSPMDFTFFISGQLLKALPLKSLGANWMAFCVRFFKAASPLD